MDAFSTSPSPTKRSNFRSKTKLKELGSTMQDTKLKTVPSFYLFLKQFPLDITEDVMSAVRSFEPTHICFLQNLENLKLYKPQLSSLFEGNWHEFLELLKSIVVKLSKRSQRLVEEKERKIIELLKMNKELQNEQQNWKNKIQKLEGLRQLESAELSMADAELEIVNGEMRSIYQVLQGDMQKVSRYLTKLQAKRATAQEEGSNQIFNSLKTMSLLLNNMENEQKSANSSLTNMRELIKAMTKCTKVTTGTQVDESQLLTKAGTIFNSSDNVQLPFNQAEASSINVGSSSDTHLIDKLKQREKDNPHQNFKLQKHAQKPWALTPTLLVFLQNMSKENQAGKVLPWEYTKQLINEIYQNRCNYQIQMTAGVIGNGMLFDEFVVFHFLNKHRIRRLAEVKLLQFIISLKYYCKYWLRAEIFCQLMDVMRYSPLFEAPDSFNYKIDYNTQNFFFTIYKKLITYTCMEEEGATYINVKQVKKLMRASLFFTDQTNKSRLLAKLDKDQRVFDKLQFCDFDYALSLFLDEYLACKKRICNNLNRAFSKKFEENQGYFSIDQMQELFQQMTAMYRTASDMQYKYPIDSKLQLGKLYLYTATSGKNSYDFNVNYFLTTCQRYGFDAPFPFLHICSKSKKRQEEQDDKNKQKLMEIETQPQRVKNINNQIKENQIVPLTAQNIQMMNLNRQRVDMGVKIFSQHFSILRQLRTYVQIFNKTLREQKNSELVWKSFQQIRKVLQKGCEFMRYPLVDHKK